MQRFMRALREMPPSARTGLVWAGAGTAFVIAMQFIVIVLIMKSSVSKVYVGASGLVMILWFPIALLGARQRMARHRAFKEHDGHLCPRCEHPLPPSEDGVRTCPECGLSQPEDEHVKFWKRWKDW